MRFEDYIPFEKKEFRTGQKDAIIKILDAIKNGDKYIILNNCKTNPYLTLL